MDNSKDKDFLNQFTLFKKLMENGDRFVRDANNFPFVPELFVDIEPVLIKIIKALNKVDPNVSASLIFGWCCFAGLGAAWHWHANWDQLQKEGIFETLTKERGIEEMDEYVLDLIELPFQEKSAKQLTDHIHESANIALIHMATALQFVNEDKKPTVYLLCCEAMYRYGMAIELNRLGMH